MNYSLLLHLFLGFFFHSIQYAKSDEGGATCTITSQLERSNKSTFTFRIEPAAGAIRLKNQLGNYHTSSYVHRDLKRIKNELSIVVHKTSSAHIERDVQVHIQQTNGLSYAAVQMSNEALSSELSQLRGQLVGAYQKRASLLTVMGYPASTTRSFIMEHEQSIPYAWQCNYFKNEQYIEELEFSITVKATCLNHNYRITAPVHAELCKAEHAFKTRTPTTKGYYRLESEAHTLQNQINEQKQLLVRARNEQNTYKINRARVEKRLNKWKYWLGAGSKAQRLKASFEYLNNRLKQVEATIKTLTKTIPHLEQEMDRLVPLISYGQQCEREHAVSIESYVLSSFKQATELIAVDSQRVQLEQLHNHYKQERVKALLDVSSVESVCCTYELLPASEQWLKEKGIVDSDAWKSCIGSSIQVEIQDELVAILNKAATLRYQNKHECVQVATETIGNFLVVAHETNDKNLTNEATKITDLCWSFLDYGFAIGEGVVEGVSNVGRMITHPAETITGIARVAHDLAYVLCEFEAIGDITNPVGEQWAQATITDYGRKINELEVVLNHTLSTMSGRDFAKAGAAMATEVLLTGRIAAAAKPLLRAAKSRVIEIIKNVPEVAPEVALAGETEIRIATETYDQIALMQSDKAKQVGTTVSNAATQVTQVEVKSALLLQDAELLKHIVDDTKKLEEAIKIFAETPSAISKDGPLTKLLDCATKYKADVGKLGTARGAAYELEKGYELAKQGEKGIAFGNKYSLKNSNGVIERTLDIDIETVNKFIECKNWDWSKMSVEGIKDKLQHLQSSLPVLQKLSASLGKKFEFHSKHLIPDSLKEWLIKREISFFEG